MERQEFLKIEAAVDHVRKSSTYKKNQIIEDFQALINAYRELILKHEK